MTELMSLPVDLAVRICEFASHDDRHCLELACQVFASVLRDQGLWQTEAAQRMHVAGFLTNATITTPQWKRLACFGCYAVNRSQLLHSVVGYSSIDRHTESPTNTLVQSDCWNAFQYMPGRLGLIDSDDEESINEETMMDRAERDLDLRRYVHMLAQNQCGCATGSACYWSSAPSTSKTQHEFIEYGVKNPAIVTGVEIVPYRAYWHPDSPTYAPMQVQFQFFLQLPNDGGVPSVPSEVAEKSNRAAFGPPPPSHHRTEPPTHNRQLVYESPIYDVENDMCLQEFTLPERVFLGKVGAAVVNNKWDTDGQGEWIFRLNMLGRHQAETMIPPTEEAERMLHPLYYCCLSFVNVVGAVLYNYGVPLAGSGVSIATSDMAGRISVQAEVLGTGSDGTEPSVVFSVVRKAQYGSDVTILKRYLFNCGEGTQRLCGENSIKLSSLDACYMTRFDVKSVSGVPGLIFALGVCGTASLRLAGPPGLRGFLHAIQSFVWRKYPLLECVEIGRESSKLDAGPNTASERASYSVWNADKDAAQEDRHVQIFAVELTEQAAASGRESASKDDDVKKWLRGFYEAKAPEKLPYIDVVLSRYRGRYQELKNQLIAKYGAAAALSGSKSSDDDDSNSSSSSDSDNDDACEAECDGKITSSWLEMFYQEHQPDKVSHVGRIMRQFSDREDALLALLRSKYGEVTVARAMTEGRKRKKQNGSDAIKRASEVKRLRGSDCADNAAADKSVASLLSTSTEAPAIEEMETIDVGSVPQPQIEEEDSRVLVAVCYVLRFRHDPSAIVWVVDCARVQFIPALCQKLDSESCRRHLPALAVHLTPALVRRHERYQQWMQAFPSSTQHLVFDPQLLQATADGVLSFSYLSSAKKRAQRHNEHADVSTLRSWSPLADTVRGIADQTSTAYQRKLVNASASKDEQERQWHLAQAKLRFELPQAVFNYERTGWVARPASAPLDEKDDGDDDDDDQDNVQAVHLQSDAISANADTALVVLGTGCAAPSKYRASSGIFVDISGGAGGVLLDCGEGTFGQLWRQFGEDTARRIGTLQCIWVSHHHADHQCGLARILFEYTRYWRGRATPGGDTGLVVIAPLSVLTHVRFWLRDLLDAGARIQLCTCNDFNQPSNPARRQLLVQAPGRLSSLLSVPVRHCYDSYGVVVTLQSGKKIVYSGDTRPCERLVQFGRDADLLIHEATFEDAMAGDAHAKKHSTVSQALDVARRMQARQVVLTHFSQRYPSPPPMSASAPTTSLLRVHCAFDGFVVRI
ncbi:TPA: hypothetical protein N0F65_006537 [Lagenidium giganteum]|uniref:ribonuclease Z n=1 Tax=Lagenidium giganteum TaxID=4803 RepID=A0AAV2YJP7_9STRA|nr:TPA: hypothetical protein N0F65_006537 [Lagenidium giganteum]